MGHHNNVRYRDHNKKAQPIELWLKLYAKRPLYLLSLLVFSVTVSLLTYLCYQDYYISDAEKIRIADLASIGIKQKNRALLEQTLSVVKDKVRAKVVLFCDDKRVLIKIPSGSEFTCSSILKEYNQMTIPIVGFNNYSIVAIKSIYQMIKLIIFSFVLTVLIMGLFAMILSRLRYMLLNGIIYPLSNGTQYIKNDSADFTINTPIVEIKEIFEKYKEHFRLINDLNEKALVQEKQAAVGKVVQHIAHDLKNPLMVVDEALYARDWNDYSSRLVNSKTAMNKLLMMVESFKKADVEGIVKPTLYTVDLKSVKDVMLPLAKKRGIELCFKQETLEKLTLDWPKVERAILNLVGNACECGADKVECHVFIDGPKLLVQVKDNGLGVPEELRDSLFQTGATHGKQDGSGLGLSFVREVARGHGGDASYRREGNESIFCFELPHADMDAWSQKPLSHSNEINPEFKEQEVACGDLQDQSSKDRSLVVVADKILYTELGKIESLKAELTDDIEKIPHALLLIASNALQMTRAMKNKTPCILAKSNENIENLSSKVHLQLKAHAKNVTT